MVMGLLVWTWLAVRGQGALSRMYGGCVGELGIRYEAASWKVPSSFHFSSFLLHYASIIAVAGPNAFHMRKFPSTAKAPQKPDSRPNHIHVAFSVQWHAHVCGLSPPQWKA